jgi:hypothetical protein
MKQEDAMGMFSVTNEIKELRGERPESAVERELREADETLARFEKESPDEMIGGSTEDVMRVLGIEPGAIGRLVLGSPRGGTAHEWIYLGLMKEATTRSSNFLEYNTRVESIPEEIMNPLNEVSVEWLTPTLLEIFAKINKKIDDRNSPNLSLSSRRDAWPLWKGLFAIAESFEEIARRALRLPAEDLAAISSGLGDVLLRGAPPELDRATA